MLPKRAVKRCALLLVMDPWGTECVGREGLLMKIGEGPASHRVCRKGDKVWVDALFVPEIELELLRHGLGSALLTAAQSRAAAESLDTGSVARVAASSDEAAGFYGGLVWFVPLLAILAATVKASC